MKNCEVLAKAKKWQHEVSPELYLRGIDMREPDKATLHFLHGVAFSSQTYWPLLKPLAEKYGLFTQDFVGHGESDIGVDLEKEFIGWRGVVEQVQAVMDSQQISDQGKPLLGLGHSYGASLSLIMAADNPELFSGLVLLDPMIFPQQMLEMLGSVSFEDNPMSSRIVERISTWSSREDARAFFASKKAFCDWREDAFEHFLDSTLQENSNDGSVSLRCPPLLEAQFVAHPLDAIWHAVETVTVPTVIIHSDSVDSPLRQSCIQAAKHNDNIKSIEVKGGHNFMQEYPQEILELVEESLAGFES
ncbi:MAG: alpha/beta hydrolase [Pseudomonadales bacterium]|nr:alpha/beta hydrolase [Pseudomonadales bacterium]